jgi:hypothetical protein
MELSDALPDTSQHGEPEATPRELPLAAGRTVVVLKNGRQDEILVRSSAGEVEVRILLTEQGPVVRLQAARLELASAGEVDVTCRKFSVHTQEETRLSSDGQVRVNATKQIVMRSRQEMDLKGRPFRVNLYDGLFDNDFFYPKENGPHWGTAFAGVSYERSPYLRLFETKVKADEEWLSELMGLLEEAERRKGGIENWLQHAAQVREQLGQAEADAAPPFSLA